MLEGTVESKDSQKSKMVPCKKKGTAYLKKMSSHLDDPSPEESKPEDICSIKGEYLTIQTSPAVHSY